MKSVGSYEAKTHLVGLLSRVERGETITLTKRGKPIAVLSPVPPGPKQDVAIVITQFRAYSMGQARGRSALNPHEFKEMVEEGRP